MDEVHTLHRYGKYSFHDILEMTARERIALTDRLNASLDAENAALEKAAKGK